MGATTLQAGNTTEEAAEILRELRHCNIILDIHDLTSMQALLMLPLGASPELESYLRMLWGLRLPEAVESELLSALIARGEIGEVPEILRRYWGEELQGDMEKVSGMNPRNAGQEVANSRRRFLHALSPGLEKLVQHEYYSWRSLTEYYPSYITYHALRHGYGTPQFTQEKQLAIVDKELKNLLSMDSRYFYSYKVTVALDEELSAFSKRRGPGEVKLAQEAVLATKVRYMNSYARGEESAQNFIATLALTLENFSLDLLVEFHALAEEYNFDWAMASFPGFTGEKSQLLQRLNTIVASTPGLEHGRGPTGEMDSSS